MSQLQPEGTSSPVEFAGQEAPMQLPSKKDGAVWVAVIVPKKPALQVQFAGTSVPVELGGQATGTQCGQDVFVL